MCPDGNLLKVNKGMIHEDDSSIRRQKKKKGIFLAHAVVESTVALVATSKCVES